MCCLLYSTDIQDLLQGTILMTQMLVVNETSTKTGPLNQLI